MPSHPAPRGFTLVELLAVAAILTLVVAGATLAVGRAVPVSSDPARLSDRFGQARALAVTGQTVLGLVIEAEGLRAATRHETGWRLGPVEPWQGAVLRVTPADAVDGTPAVVFLPTGQTTAFAVTFDGPRGVIRCETDGWTGLRCAAGP